MDFNKNFTFGKFGEAHESVKGNRAIREPLGKWLSASFDDDGFVLRADQRNVEEGASTANSNFVFLKLILGAWSSE